MFAVVLGEFNFAPAKTVSPPQRFLLGMSLWHKPNIKTYSYTQLTSPLLSLAGHPCLVVACMCHLLACKPMCLSHLLPCQKLLLNAKASSWYQVYYLMARSITAVLRVNVHLLLVQVDQAFFASLAQYMTLSGPADDKKHNPIKSFFIWAWDADADDTFGSGGLVASDWTTLNWEKLGALIGNSTKYPTSLGLTPWYMDAYTTGRLRTLVASADSRVLL